MTQVPFGFCVNPRNPQPFLSSPDVGTYTVPEHASCFNGGKWTDDKRRPDVRRMYERNVPKMSMLQGIDALPVEHTGAFDTIPTEQGPISVPRSVGAKHGFMPTSALLTALPFTGTRRSGISDRYY
jgi:hypothetical protein